MTTIQEAQAAAKAKMDQQNPANAPGKPVAERTRIPLSVPTRKLEVPEIPGFYLRWFRGTPQRLAQAELAGFVFVTPDEVKLNNVTLGGDAKKDGNTDLGSHVSVVEGSEVDGAGQAVRLYLMKQPMEYFKQDQAILNDRNDSVAAALTNQFQNGTLGLERGERADDVNSRYVDRNRSKLPDLFRKKRR